MPGKFSFSEESQGFDREIPIEPKLSRQPVLRVMTVMFADLVGSTAAKEKYGHSGAMKRTHFHNRSAEEAVIDCSGTVVKNLGDGILAVFSSSFDAVAAAIFFRSNLETAKLQGIEFQDPPETRITLTTGALEEMETASGYDIAGHVVDKAARLQKYTLPGQILAEVGVVEPVLPKIKEEMPYIKIPSCKYYNEVQLKGFNDPTRVLEITTTDKPFINPQFEGKRKNLGRLLGLGLGIAVVAYSLIIKQGKGQRTGRKRN